MSMMQGTIELPETAGALNSDAAWDQLVRRQPDARFFYGVITTGVFCRANCGSRRPLRENVRFFQTTAEATAAGFRACLRCRPETDGISLVQRTRKHIESNYDRSLSLKELAVVAGASPFTVQRVFKQAMGASPLQYQRALRAQKMREGLKGGETVTTAIYNAGYGSSSRAYEDRTLGMAPSRFAKGGAGEEIGFTTAQTPFGWMVLGATDRGLCWLALAESEERAEATLREEFPAAVLHRNASLSGMVDAALASVREGADLSEGRHGGQALDLRGTVFQLRVWQALRQIPRGETRTYSQLAREMGEPSATRAVARACALNRVSVLVPCHRVVGVSGSLTGYRWGVERKRRLLDAERDPAPNAERT